MSAASQLMTEFTSLSDREREDFARDVTQSQVGQELAISILHAFPDSARKNLLVNQASTLSGQDRQSLIKDLAGSPHERQEVVQTLMSEFSEKERTKTIRRWSPPSPKVRDKIWLDAVRGFIFVMIVGAIALSLAVFLPANGKAAPELILSVFTTVAGFLAGFLVPSPLQAREGERQEATQQSHG